MADNYLEKKFEEYREGRHAAPKHKITHPSLDSLLLKNRSCRGYDASYTVTEEELRKMAAACTKVPSARNQQVLRFKLVYGEQASLMDGNYGMGGALPQLHLPLEGTKPNAFIIICSTRPEDRWVDMDLGIAAQSILLKAVEMGLNGICLGSFNKEAVKRNFRLQLEPLLVLAIGKSVENIQLLSVKEGADLDYYRKDGVHFVPKIELDDLILQ